MYKIISAILILSSASLFAQKPKEKPCTGAEYELMDFWVGDWALSWSPGKTGKNTVNKILDGCVVEENFDGNPGVKDYFGKSFSMYDKKTKQWKQVWVDSQGGWLDFKGEQVGDEVHFTRKSTNANGAPIIQRMRFYNIDFRNFDWSWESSENNGQTWKVNWALHYERLKSAASN